MTARNLLVSNSIVSRSRCFCNFHNLFMRVGGQLEGEGGTKTLTYMTL